MSWRAFPTGRQADLVRLHLIFNIWEEVQLALALPWLLTMSVSVSFDWSGAGQPNRDNGQWRHSAGTGVLILKQSTPLGSARPRGDNCKPMNGTTGSQSLAIEASRMKGEENWAVASLATKGSLTSLACPHAAA